VLRYLDRRVAEGAQVVIITPRIEASESSDLIAATQCVEDLRGHAELGRRRIELLHGRLSAEERHAVLERLRHHQLDVLVATTVVEVGLDVPGLTVAVIEHPERFGLGQLHQLRGRVGRGRRRGECILQLDPRLPPPARERLTHFTRTQDGFQVAALDLETRGVGELLGRRQHGFEGFQVADLARDRQLLEEARRIADRLLLEDPDLDGYPVLRRRLEQRADLAFGSASCSSSQAVITG
jgi:ATP-dependent DNA helicase RecG